MEIMSALAVSPAYSALLAKFPPRIIRSEEQNESYINALYELEQQRDSWSPDEKDLADLFTLLIEDFEEKHYALPKGTSTGVIEFLMDQHDLKQKDLTDVFGTPSIVSEVLSGKRELNKEHIRRLSERFHVSPELFF
jgi:HTH-type transcriptional regulator / antitoxin HigA